MDNIVNITIIDRNDVEHKIEAPTDMGMNLMELCRANELPVKGTCGGMALCASCQCYVINDPGLEEQSDDELDMLDQALHVEDNSRLGCQIQLTEAIEGLIVKLAPEEED